MPGGGGFLQPSAAEQAALREKREERARAEKQAQAARRKAKKARVAELELGMRERQEAREAPAAPVVLRPEDKERDDAIAEYLGTKPYWGRSAFANLELIKELCGPEGERAYDRTRKLWGTRVVTHLRRLLQSHQWEPVGVPEEWWPALLAAADAKAEAEMRHAEAVAQERRERLLEEQAHRERAAARRARQEAECVEREAEAAREAERAAERERLREKSERARTTEPPTDDEVAACHALGFEEATIEASHARPGSGRHRLEHRGALAALDGHLPPRRRRGARVHAHDPRPRRHGRRRAACKRETVERLNAARAAGKGGVRAARLRVVFA